MTRLSWMKLMFRKNVKETQYTFLFDVKNATKCRKPQSLNCLFTVFMFKKQNLCLNMHFFCISKLY